jgi:hypothetical protein
MDRMVMAFGTALVLAASPTATRAQGRTDHAKLPIETFVETYEAGDVCPFPYQLEGLGGTVIRNRVFDADGNRLRAILIGVETLRHTNLDTGFTLEEELHGTIQRDFVTGEEMHTGNFWHGRTEDGKLVLVHSGRFVVDLSTGELLETTPNTGVEFEATICPALAGEPASP